jgi:hypothetical protein
MLLPPLLVPLPLKWPIRSDSGMSVLVRLSKRLPASCPGAEHLSMRMALGEPPWEHEVLRILEDSKGVTTYCKATAFWRMKCT